MHWLLIVVVVIALLAAASINFRFGAGLLTAILLLAVVLFFVSDGSHFNLMRAGINPDDVNVTHTRATPAYAGSWKIRTRIENRHEEHPVRELELSVQSLDCPVGSTTGSDACAIVASESYWLVVNIPPGESRDAEFTISPDKFSVTGTLLWRSLILEARTH